VERRGEKARRGDGEEQWGNKLSLLQISII